MTRNALTAPPDPTTEAAADAAPTVPPAAAPTEAAPAAGSGSATSVDTAQAVSPARPAAADGAPPRLVDVAVALPIHRTYTYRVPDSLRDSVAPGVLVRVPVRNRRVEGVVVRFTPPGAAPPATARLKDIQQILTPGYTIPPDLLALGAWMSEYYLAGPGEALQAIAFFGLTDQGPRIERRLRLAETPPTDVRVTPTQQRVVDFLTARPGESLAPGALAEAAGVSDSVVAVLRRKGVLAEVAVETTDDTSAEDPHDDGYDTAPAPHLVDPHTLSDEQRAAYDRIVARIEPKQAGGPHHNDPERQQAGRPHHNGDPSEPCGAGVPPAGCGAGVSPAGCGAGVSPAIPPAPGFECFLLHGITGSGKTEIYLQALTRVLALGREAIVLVPEISLTPQAVARFRARFGSVVGVYHSHLTRLQKYRLWRRIAAGRVRVLIGARSAIFAPFPHLGLIVVDEEHEHSYKQSDPAPRYHARDVAVWRARQAGIPVVLGSATPSLESWLNALPPEEAEGAGRGKYTLLQLLDRAGGARLPEIRLIDMAAHVREERHTGLISLPLEQAIRLRLERHEQVILFLNRRGFANFLLCMACKMPVRCPHCDVVMTWHKAIGKIMCHFCGQESPVPKECPSCGMPGLAPMGAGTQRIEEEINTLFPDARTLRIDYDTTRGRYGFLDLWKKIEGGEADILLGTQMIAKGLHLERVTLVGVVSADHALFLPDFRAAERAFSQLTQVAGRAGRMQQQGQVIVQTFVPHHYAIQRAIAHDMDGFLRQELHMRSVLRFPPLWKLLLVRFTGADPEHVAARAQRLGALLRAAQERARDFRPLSVLGPAPCPIARLKDKTRWQLIIRGQESALMRRWLLGSLAALEKEKGAADVAVTIDMDPCDVL